MYNLVAPAPKVICLRQLSSNQLVRFSAQGSNNALSGHALYIVCVAKMIL